MGGRKAGHRSCDPGHGSPEYLRVSGAVRATALPPARQSAAPAGRRPAGLWQLSYGHERAALRAGRSPACSPPGQTAPSGDGQPHRPGIVPEPLPSPAGVVPQPGAGIDLGRLPRRVRAGRAGEGARRDFAPAQVAVVGGLPRPAVRASPPPRKAHRGLPSRDRLLTVDCGQRGRALWTGAHVMDWRYAAHLQLRTIVAGSHGSRRTAGPVSQADSAGSIPVTRSR